MQEYRKLLCVNKIRETKRLIENMLIPILCKFCPNGTPILKLAVHPF